MSSAAIASAASCFELAQASLSTNCFSEAFEHALDALQIALQDATERDANDHDDFPFQVQELMEWARLAQTATANMVPPEDSKASIQLVDLLLKLASLYIAVPPEAAAAAAAATASEEDTAGESTERDNETSTIVQHLPLEDDTWKIALQGIVQCVENLVSMLIQDAQGMPIRAAQHDPPGVIDVHTELVSGENVLEHLPDAETIEEGTPMAGENLNEDDSRGALELAITYQDIVIAFKKRLHGGRWNSAVEEALTLQSHLMENKQSYAAAVALKRTALAICAKVHGEKSMITLDRMRQLTECLLQLGRFEEAEEVAKRTLQLEQELVTNLQGTASHCNDSPDLLSAKEEVALTLGRLAEIATSLERYTSAEEYQRQGLDVSRELHGNQSHQVAGDLHNLASIIAFQGRNEEALVIGREAVACAQSVMQSDDPLLMQYREWWEDGTAVALQDPANVLPST